MNYRKYTMKKIFKKLLSLIIFLIFAQIPSFAEEISELYLIKKSALNDIKAVSDFYSRQNNLTVDAQSSYSVSYITDSDYFVVFFEQTGDDVYFYYYSPSKTDYSYKDIISRLKGRHYSCKREKNQQQKLIFYNKVKAIKGTQKLTTATNQEVNSPSAQIYDFSDTAQEKYDKINKVLTNRPKQSPQLEIPDKNAKKEEIIVNKDDYVTIPDIETKKQEETPVRAGKYDIPAGLTLNTVIQSDIETSSLAENDRISAILQNDLYINNKLTAKSGSIVYGNVVEVKKASGGYKNGALVLQFDTMLTTDGEKLTLKTEKCNFSLSDNSRGKKIAGQVTGTALAGAVGGLLTGLLTAAITSSSIKKGIGYGAAIGAGAGAISGIVSAATSKGEDVSITEGTPLVLKTVSY